jgi:hypothetical protein
MKNQALVELQFQLKTNHEKIITLESALSKAEDKILSLLHNYHFCISRKSKLSRPVEAIAATDSKETVLDKSIEA